MVIAYLKDVCLPYCIDQQSDGRFVFLNWQYKPIGFATQDFMEYGDYPIAHVIPDLTPDLIEKIAVKVDKNPLRIYLYNDSTDPLRSPELMSAYLKRLELLSKLETAY